MDVNFEAVEVVGRIRARFPEEAARTDAWLVERGWEPTESPHHWVEAFADRTTEAMRADNWSRVKEHTEFLSSEYCAGSEDVKSLVDVSYAENLMWDLDNAAKVRSWPYIADEVRRLHEEMWGAPQ